MGDAPNPDASFQLMHREQEGWDELHRLIDALTPEQAGQPGYFVEGWSAKDVLAHIGTWLAEAGVLLERIAMNTYRFEEIDVDAMNERFYETMKDVPLETVRVQAWTARTRMVRAWGAQPDSSDDAMFWIAKSGPEHYDEHLPRLREWVKELAG